MYLGTCLISWSAKKQSTVARSSTEVKYRCLTQTATEICWISYLLQDLRIPLYSPLTLHCGNLGALALATNPVFHARTKHIEIDFHFIRDMASLKRLSLRYLCVKDQSADTFTKALSPARFKLLLPKLSPCVCPFGLKEDNRGTQETKKWKISIKLPCKLTIDRCRWSLLSCHISSWWM